jgi:hypothetical protein
VCDACINSTLAVVMHAGWCNSEVWGLNDSATLGGIWQLVLLSTGLVWLLRLPVDARCCVGQALYCTLLPLPAPHTMQSHDHV